jgi:hypothetical protein
LLSTATSSAFFPLPEDPEMEIAELFGGPYDGELLAVFPHTHGLIMPGEAHYDFAPDLTTHRRIPVYRHVRKPTPTPVIP